MLHLRFGEQLTPLELENKLRGYNPATLRELGWTVRTKNEGISFDLEQVRFAEFGCLAQIAVLVEGAVRHGVPVRICLPSQQALPHEIEQIDAARGSDSFFSVSERIADEIARRKDVVNFLLHTNFLQAIRVDHVPHSDELVEIIGGYGPLRSPVTGTSPIQRAQSDRAPYYLSRIFPLTWIDPTDQNRFLKSPQFIATLRGLVTEGLNTLDAQTLSSSVLSELVENVHDHAFDDAHDSSCPPKALIGAIVLPPQTYSKRRLRAGYHGFMGRFLVSGLRFNSPIVRLVVADSGQGIVQSLGSAFEAESEQDLPAGVLGLSRAEKVLFWAMTKWSTSRDLDQPSKRGIRGLWRVLRVVQSYFGFLQLRSERGLVGWDLHSPSAAIPVSDQRMSYFPGTMLDLWFHTAAPRAVARGARQLVSGARKLEFEFARYSPPPRSQEAGAELLNILRKAPTDPSHIRCIILTLEEKLRSARRAEEVLQETHSEIRAALEDASNLAGPALIALLIPDSHRAALMSASESLDLDSDDAASADLREPLLVIDARGRSWWFAGNQKVRSFLQKNWSSESDSLSDAFSRGEQEEPTLDRELAGHTEIVEFTEEGPTLLISPGDLIEGVIETVSTTVE